MIAEYISLEGAAEATGRGEIIAYGGDWEHQELVDVVDLDALRAAMFSRHAAMASEDA